MKMSGLRLAVALGVLFGIGGAALGTEPAGMVREALHRAPVAGEEAVVDESKYVTPVQRAKKLAMDIDAANAKAAEELAGDK